APSTRRRASFDASRGASALVDREAQLLDAPAEGAAGDLEALGHAVQIAGALAVAALDLGRREVARGPYVRAPLDDVVDRRARDAEVIRGGLEVPRVRAERGDQLRLGDLRRPAPG